MLACHSRTRMLTTGHVPLQENQKLVQEINDLREQVHHLQPPSVQRQA